MQQSGISNTLKWNLPVKEVAINFPAAALVALVAAVLRGEAQPALSVSVVERRANRSEAPPGSAAILVTLLLYLACIQKPCGDFLQKSDEGLFLLLLQASGLHSSDLLAYHAALPPPYELELLSSLEMNYACA